MANMNFSTSNQTFGQLMGNGLTYRIPRFQRDYSWEEDHWEDLWQDMLGLFGENPEPVHYMGYLVLQSEDGKRFDVIDGQQRITTLSLFILAALRVLQEIEEAGENPGDNRRRAEQLRNSYIGFLDPVTLIARSKLELNRNNDEFYQTYLVPLQELPKRGLKASEHLLRKAFEWFREHLRTHLKTADRGKELAEFVQGIAGNLVFTVISVTDELNAFKVFETLNARGVRLSSTDLLKNYLFSVVHAAGSHENEMMQLEQRWQKIVGNLTGEKLPDFLRVYWNSKNRLVRKTELFKAIRGEIQTKEQVFALLRNLDRDSNIYAALRNPDDELWSDKGLRRMVATLRTFGVQQPLSLLLATHRAFPPGEEPRRIFERVLHAICIVSFRYNVICGLHTNDQERVYSEVAVKVSNGVLNNISGILKELRRVYPTDRQFESAFADKSLVTTSGRNKAVVRYLLAQLEKHVSGIELDPNASNLTLEHILPENPAEGWQEFDAPQGERFKYNIGNLTLLESDKNRALGNAEFRSKRTVYSESAYKITSEIAENFDEWSPESIRQRQEEMARMAKRVWRLPEADVS